MGTKVEVHVGKHGESEIEDFNILQGELKSLSTARYTGLKNNIVKEGFRFPMFVWFDSKKLMWTMDGTQRKRTLIKMRSEGFEIPKIPWVEILADNRKHAIRLILLATSRFGDVDPQGLHQLMEEGGVAIADITSELIALPDLDHHEFAQEYYNVEPPWDTDIALVDNVDPKLDGLMAFVKVKCPAKKKDQVVELIREAVKKLKGVDLV